MAEEVVKTKKPSKLKNFLKGILIENPLFVMVLGTCPALATTTSIEGAIGMGILFSIVLICSSVIISSLRKVIPDEIRTPAYIVIIATFVTIVKMLANAFLPELYATLGVFISLIVVNCIVLGRAEAYASKNTVIDSLLDACGMGIGYTLALLIMATCREVIGSGMITFGRIFTFIPLTQIPVLKYVANIAGSDTVIYDYSISLLQRPAGAFIVFGIIMAVIGFNNNRKADIEFVKKRNKGTLPVKPDDDKRVNLLRIIMMASTALLGVITFTMMFVTPTLGGGNWNTIYFGSDTINGATPAAIGFILALISAILAGVSIIYNKNWNLKYIWLSIASAVIGVIATILILSGASIFNLVNPNLEPVGLGAGGIVGGLFAILTSLCAVGGLIAPGLLDSYIVAHPKATEEEVK